MPPHPLENHLSRCRVESILSPVGEERGIIDHEIRRPSVVGSPVVMDVPQQDAHQEPDEPIHSEFISDITAVEDSFRAVHHERVDDPGGSCEVAVGVGHERLQTRKRFGCRVSS